MPKRPSATNRSFVDQALSPTGIILLLVLFLVVSGGMYLYARKGTFGPQLSKMGKKAPTPKPTPTPIKLTPDNGTKGTYNVSSGKMTKGPLFSQIVFDPLDARKGSPLTISVKITNDTPVQTVTGSLQMDNTIVQLSFNKTSETGKTSIWETTLSPLPDTVWYMYVLTVQAVGSNGTNSIITAPRSR